MRVFLAPSIFMQRFAWLRLAALVGQGRARKASEIAASAYSIASASMTPKAEELSTLVEYAQVRQAVERLGSFEQVPAQDLWLARSPVSWNGSFTRESAAEIAKWAAAYGFLRSPDFTTTPAGRRLTSLRTIDDRDWAHSTTNPFVLAPLEQLHFLLAMWDADGDLLRHWVPLLPSDRIFDRSTGGDLLVPAIRGLAEEVGGKEREQLESFARTLEKQSGESSSRGLREHWATSRLEQFVDLGILVKPRLPRFEFNFAPTATEFLRVVGAARDPFVVARSFWAPGSLEADSAITDQALIDAFPLVRSSAGMAEIEDLWLRANAELMLGPNPSWISREAADSQVRRWLSDGRATFNVDKLGRVKYVKLRSTNDGSSRLA